MIHLRPAAAQEIQRLLQHRPQSTNRMRINLRPSDCAEWAYDLGPADTVSGEEITINCGDLQVVVAQDHLLLLQDLTIDYSEDLMGGGFRFMNPQAQQTCGCGNAFSVTAAATAEGSHNSMAQSQV
ncbi:MAG: HesB/IscA family protein [Spirulina sp.]